MVAKPKTEIMKAMRLKRQQMGLVEFNVWLTPEHKQKLQDLLAKLTKDQPALNLLDKVKARWPTCLAHRESNISSAAAE